MKDQEGGREREEEGKESYVKFTVCKSVESLKSAKMSIILAPSWEHRGTAGGPDQHGHFQSVCQRTHRYGFICVQSDRKKTCRTLETYVRRPHIFEVKTSPGNHMRTNPNTYFLLYFFFYETNSKFPRPSVFTVLINTQTSAFQLHLELVSCQSNKLQQKPLATGCTKYCGFGSWRGERRR